jgi:hypothetical protein
MLKSKDAFSIGARVRHTSDTKLIEGVVVWKHSESLPHMKGRVWNVHWSGGGRGIYATEDIQRIPPKSLKKIVESQLDNEDIVADEKE